MYIHDFDIVAIWLLWGEDFCFYLIPGIFLFLLSLGSMGGGSYLLDVRHGGHVF